MCGTPVVGIRGSHMDRIIPSNQNRWAEQNSPDSLEAAISQSAKLDLAAIGVENNFVSVRVHPWFRFVFALIRVHSWFIFSLICG